MVERLRALLEEPLDPCTARAVLVLASAVLIGFTALFVLSTQEPDHSSPRSAVPRPTATEVDPAPTNEAEPEPAAGHLGSRQDPQDEPGSPAGRRAARALRSHRALQHVPYRDGELTVELVGARGRRAVLRVSADTIRAARRGWHRFLRRYRDSGRAYVPAFRGKGGHSG